MSEKSDEKENKKDFILNKLHQAYEREISTLWQRSIFLGAFILAISTIFGSVISKVIEIAKMNISNFRGIEISLLLISALGVIFSILWIFMARASKANQEICEMRIIAISKKLEMSADKCCENVDEGSFEEETGVQPYVLGCVNPNIFENYIGWKHECNSKFFSLKAGNFSVSKINIIIGYIFFIIYSIFGVLVNLVLFLLTFCEKNKTDTGGNLASKDSESITYFDWIKDLITNYKINVKNICIGFILFILCIFLIASLVKKLVKSGYIMQS